MSPIVWYALCPVANACIGCFLAFVALIVFALIVNHYSEKKRRRLLTAFADETQCRYEPKVKAADAPEIVEGIAGELSEFPSFEAVEFTEFNHFMTGVVDRNDIIFFDYYMRVKAGNATTMKYGTLLLASNDGMRLPTLRIEPVEGADTAAELTIETFEANYTIAGDAADDVILAIKECALPLLTLDRTLRIEMNADRFVVFGLSQIGNDALLEIIRRTIQMGMDCADRLVFP